MSKETEKNKETDKDKAITGRVMAVSLDMTSTVLSLNIPLSNGEVLTVYANQEQVAMLVADLNKAISIMQG